MNESDTALPPECDFCGQALDGDETLSPVYIGDPPQPEAFELTGFAPKQSGFDGRFLGHTVGELSALFRALEDDRIDFETFDRVIKTDGGEPFTTDSGTSPPKMVTVESTDKCSARVTVEPEPEERDPDLEVCPLCRDNLRDEAGGWSPSD